MTFRQTPVERAANRRDKTLRRYVHTWVTGAQTVGTNKFSFRVPESGEFISCVLHLDTVNTGATFIADVNKNGTTLYTTQTRRPTIAISAADKTSTETAQADITTLTAGDIVSVDVDQVGSTVAGTGLTVTVIYDA